MVKRKLQNKTKSCTERKIDDLLRKTSADRLKTQEVKTFKVQTGSVGPARRSFSQDTRRIKRADIYTICI